MAKEPNWWPGIQKQQPFVRGVEPDNPRHLTKAQMKRVEEKPPPEQLVLPMDVKYLEPVLCPECFGMGREKKGRICRACEGKGVVPSAGNDPGEAV